MMKTTTSMFYHVQGNADVERFLGLPPAAAGDDNVVSGFFPSLLLQSAKFMACIFESFLRAGERRGVEVLTKATKHQRKLFTGIGWRAHGISNVPKRANSPRSCNKKTSCTTVNGEILPWLTRLAMWPTFECWIRSSWQWLARARR